MTESESGGRMSNERAAMSDPIRDALAECLPCPFCGKADHLLIYHDPRTVLHPWYRIECDYCGANGPGTDQGDHVDEWNNRAAIDAARKETP
jgi:Lar family restriction alleviation protein